MIVKLFSRNDIINFYNTNEYFICINSSGGPDSVPVLNNFSDNVLNLWFDDVEKNEYKWGEDVQQWFNAKAITHEQSNNLYNFLEQIPNESVVNVYCSKGVSRSGAIAKFLEETRYARIVTNRDIIPNQRVLSLLYNSKNRYIQTLRYQFDLDELKSYYYDLESNFQHLKWTLEYRNDVNGAEKHNLKGFYGWGIQSNLDDLSKPCPPYDVHKTGSTNYKNTELVFGFTKKLLERFPYARQLGIAVHPPGIEINQHIDNDEFVKVHFPIISNTNSYFCFGNHSFVMEPGYGYLIDTRYPHGTIQHGDDIRVHLLMKLPIDYISDTLK